MAYKFPKLSPTLLSKLQRIVATTKAHRFWVVTVTVTVLTMSAALIVGATSAHRASEFRAQEEQLSGILSQVDRWQTEFRATTPAESLVWRNSERVLEELQEGAADPATVASLIADRAERLGIGDVQVRIAAVDSASAPASRSLGQWTLEPQTPPLQVQFDTGITGVVEFIQTLPPHVEVRQVRLSRRGDGVRAELILLAYRAKRS